MQQFIVQLLNFAHILCCCFAQQRKPENNIEQMISSSYQSVSKHCALPEDIILSSFLSISVSGAVWTCLSSVLGVFVFFCRHTIGDSKVPFCLQSCVKPLKYAIAVNDHGTEYVHSFIGKEPSGLRFNKLFLNEEGEPPCIRTALIGLSAHEVLKREEERERETC